MFIKRTSKYQVKTNAFCIYYNETEPTLFEVAISLCSSLEDVIKGTLHRGSYVSLFWKKDI